MLLRFSFSNFRSFRDEQELSLIASSFGREPVPGVKEGVCRVCAIYGANASGKSNVLKALQFVVEAVLNSHRSWEPGQPIPLPAFKGTEPGLAARFVLDFVVSGIRYQLQFRATHTEIVEEGLYSFPNGRRQKLYHRSDSSTVDFGRALPGDNKVISGLMRKNSLFLAVAAQNNHEALGPVYEWFRSAIHFTEGGSPSPALTTSMFLQPERRQRISDLLHFADLGVESAEIDRIQFSETQEKFRSAMESRLREFAERDEFSNFPPPSKDGYPEISLLHRVGGELAKFESDDESRGTLTYFGMLGPVLRALEDGSVLVVDEMDASLHPSLTAFIIGLFHSAASNPRAAQLIFNTHDTSLPGAGVLERDEVWFTEKSREGVSRLYPLSDFKSRAGDDFPIRYLQGRFGGVPFINSERMSGLPNADAKS